MSLCSNCRSPRVLACAGVCKTCFDARPGERARIVEAARVARWRAFVAEVDAELEGTTIARMERELLALLHHS